MINQNVSTTTENKKIHALVGFKLQFQCMRNLSIHAA